MKRIFSSATTSPRSRTLARRTSTGPPRFGLPDAAHGHGARYGRGHPAISNPSTWRQRNQLRRSAPEPARAGRLHVQVRSEDRRWPQADGKEEQCYLSTWRIAPFGRFWQARHPPRYAAFNQSSSPKFPLNSASIRDRLIALALYRMASATPEADEAHPQSHSNANPISLLERLYRLRLVSAGILWRGG